MSVFFELVRRNVWVVIKIRKAKYLIIRYLAFLKSGATRKRTITVSLLIVSLLYFFKFGIPHDLAHDCFSLLCSLLAGLLLQRYKKLWESHVFYMISLDCFVCKTIIASFCFVDKTKVICSYSMNKINLLLPL